MPQKVGRCDFLHNRGGKSVNSDWIVGGNSNPYRNPVTLIP